MPRLPSGPYGRRGGLLGLYALAQMARVGPVHGYLISERIAERTDGAWRPGPGAIYPALARLASRGLARSKAEGRRRVFAITPRGRRLLARIRARHGVRGRGAPDLSVLWAEVAGVDDVGAFLVRRLRRTLDALEAAVEKGPARAAAAARGELRAAVVGELTERLARLSRPKRRGRGRLPAAGRRGGR